MVLCGLSTLSVPVALQLNAHVSPNSINTHLDIKIWHCNAEIVCENA